MKWYYNKESLRYRILEDGAGLILMLILIFVVIFDGYLIFNNGWF